MKKISKKDKSIIKQALLYAEIEDMNAFPNLDIACCEYVFSERYLTQIKQLCSFAKKQEHKYLYIRNKAYYKATILLIALLFCLLSTVTVYAVVWSVRMYLKKYEDHSDVYYDISEAQAELIPSIIETQFAPSYIPDGYGLDYPFESDTMYAIVYVNTTRSSINYIQYTLSTNGPFINTEGVVVEDIIIHDNPGIYYANLGVITVLWNNEEYGFSVSADESIGKDELMKIAESLMPNVIQNK